MAEELSKRRRCTFFDDYRVAYKAGFAPRKSEVRPHADFSQIMEKRREAQGIEPKRYSARMLTRGSK